MIDIEGRRTYFAQMFTRPLPAEVTATETTLGGRPALELRPASGIVGEDVLLYFHGGGFVVGSARSTAHLPAALLNHLDGRALSPDYRLAPEHPFPAAPEDCLAAYRELLDSGADPARLMVAGDSAGAALALATMLRARDAGLPLPVAAVLFSPAVDLTLGGESVRSKDGVDPVFAPADIAWLFEQYLAGADGTAPEASPLFADLTGLPPLLIQVGSSELLLDDAVRLAGRASAAEVAVTLEVAPRQPHVFQHDAGSEQARHALERAGRFLAARRAEAVAGRLAGRAITPGDEDYDTERSGWQTARRHRPDLIVSATGPEDVQAAVRYARDHGLPVAVQGTGHATAAVAIDGGVLITTARMSAVRVDAAARTAWVAAGTTWHEVVGETALDGLAPLSGSAPHVGAVSYTLGGGLGLLSRTYGYAADHVRALEVVTADGRLRHVTHDSDPDLFWALRGGRDNFGIVTAMEIDLMPVATIYGGALVYTADKAPEVIDAYLRWTTTVPEEMNSSIALIAMPDIPAIPEPLRGRRSLHLRIAHTGAAGPDLVAPLRALGPIADNLGELAYADAGSIHNDPVAPAATESETAMLGELDTAAVTALLGPAGPDSPVPHVIELRHLGGRMAHPAAVPNAVGNRDARYLLSVVSRLGQTGLDEVRDAHARLLAAIGPWSTGGRFVNFMNGADAAAQVRSAYSPGDHERLAALKAVYDPANTFRLNHNIAPVRN